MNHSFQIAKPSKFTREFDLYTKTGRPSKALVDWFHDENNTLTSKAYKKFLKDGLGGFEHMLHAVYHICKEADFNPENIEIE